MNLSTFLQAYIEAALWSSTGAPFDICPCCEQQAVLCRWDEDGEPVCSNCSDREPNHEPPLDDSYGPEDLTPATLSTMEAECKDFIEAQAELLEELSAAQAGHDFWLTRNRHGTGFWDRVLGEVGKALTEAAHTYGSCDLCVGDDGMIYC